MTEAEIGDLVGRDRAELSGDLSEVGLEIGEIVRRLQGEPDADGAAAAAAASADAPSQAPPP
jgi:hypothetical protein